MAMNDKTEEVYKDKVAWANRQIEKQAIIIKHLEETLRIIKHDFDHDNDAHKYDTPTCRVCLAINALLFLKEQRGF